MTKKFEKCKGCKYFCEEYIGGEHYYICTIYQLPPCVKDIHNSCLQRPQATDKEDFEKRLDELSKLEKGWYDGEGEVISSLAIETTKNLVSELTSFGMIYPLTAPTEEGGVCLEWVKTDGKWSCLSIDIDPEGEIELIF